MEYVKISYPEKKYGERNLLYSQMQLINTNKRILAYKEIRNKEIALKLELKIKINEALELLSKLDKMLPHVKMHAEEKLKEKILQEHEVKKEDFEDELQRIKRKLSALQERF